MRVTRSQIVNGLSAYIDREILPRMDEDRALKIIFGVGVNAIKANGRLLDKWLGSDIARALMDDDGAGSYDIERLMDWLRASIEEYGAFPVSIPPIPLISPRVITIKLGADDVAAIRRAIESATE